MPGSRGANSFADGGRLPLEWKGYGRQAEPERARFRKSKEGGIPMRRLVDTAGLAGFLSCIAAALPDPDDIVMLCIGTDRSTGDAFGPLLGSRLLEAGWPHVYGTLREPCDADRLPDVLAGLPAGKTVIAFDACLGSPANVGKYSIARGPLLPAEAVGKRLPEAGHYSAAAVVAARSAKPYYALMTAPLSLVIDMAESAAAAAAEAWRLTPATSGRLRRDVHERTDLDCGKPDPRGIRR